MVTWKPIPSFWNYQASDDGQVRNINGRIIKGTVTAKGYIRVCMSDKHMFAHRAVASAFGLDISQTIDHIDGNKTNNSLNNLRPCSTQENTCFYTGKDQNMIGVFLNPDGKYQARAYINGKAYSAGSHDTIEQANEAYKAVILDPSKSTNRKEKRCFHARIKNSKLDVSLGRWLTKEEANRAVNFYLKTGLDMRAADREGV